MKEMFHITILSIIHTLLSFHFWFSEQKGKSLNQIIGWLWTKIISYFKLYNSESNGHMLVTFFKSFILTCCLGY